MPTIKIGGVLMLAIATSRFVASLARAAEAPLSEAQLVEIAIEANPAGQVGALPMGLRGPFDQADHRAGRSHLHTTPTATAPRIRSGARLCANSTSPRRFNFRAKRFISATKRSVAAEIAHLALAATVRDVRAATETGYYQLVLDEALTEVNDENVHNLDQVVRVTETAYSASAVPQTDVISSEFDLAAARQLQRQYLTAVANDETALNLQLYRPVGSPLSVDRTLKLEALTTPLDALTDRAYAVRQEILEAALAERNANTALYLAKMEYLPDFTAGVQYDDYLVPQLRPQPKSTAAIGSARSVSTCRSFSGSSRTRTLCARRPTCKPRGPIRL